MLELRIARGRCLPLGASAVPDGVNFAILSVHATAATLALFTPEGNIPLAEIPLDPLKNRTGNHWHVQVGGLPSSFSYGWRIDGPKGPLHRFDPTHVLIDPASTALSGEAVWARSGEPADFTARRSLYFRRPYNWAEDVPPLVPLEDSIIYELHVRGFTCHPSSGVRHPGTFAGLVEKVPYLMMLGVTAVELLPIHEFDENDCPFFNPTTGEKLRNFWGYNSIAFAAPKAAFAATGPHQGQLNEFRDLVRSFHLAGLEVILDVVFNHTGEGDDRGRTSSFRGIDNQLYYMLDQKGRYLNFSGCGNTVNCNHPLVRDLMINCLRYWVADMHVDGLRFDLASVLGRGPDGHVLPNPPVLEMISADGVLAGTKLIAEPWDAAGLYQVGAFPYGHRWTEWNGMYRDCVRRFWKGEPGLAGQLATRVCGSADLYEKAGRKPFHSINFVTCHDGFTLHDLVSYNHKWNRANGEDNRDGSDDNHSWNCGVEGPTTDKHVLELRQRQARNLFATLMLSQGVPMVLAGDEFLRTQNGNNNAWCQDNAVGWVDWSRAEQQSGFLRFCREMIALRKRHPALRRREFLKDGDIIWHGTKPNQPDFSPTGRTLAFALDGRRTRREPDVDLYVAMNAWREAVTFILPRSPQGGPWRRLVDTSLPPPQDIVEAEEGVELKFGTYYVLAGNALLVLAAPRP